MLLVGGPVAAQGQWTPNWVPCTVDGTPTSLDASGFEEMGGSLTGSASGSQTVPCAPYGKYYYFSGPISCHPDGVTMTVPYDPGGDDGISGIYANSTNGFLLNDEGPDTSVTSTVSGQAKVNLIGYFLWQPSYSGGGTPPPVPPPPPTNFLLQTSVSACYSASYQHQIYDTSPAPSGGMTGSASIQDDVFKEQAQITVPPPPYAYSFGNYNARQVSPAAGGLHLVTSTAQVVNGKWIYTITLSATTSAQAANSLDGTKYVGHVGTSTCLLGSVRPDSREVTISAGVDNTYMKAPAYYSSGVVRFDAYNNIVFTPVHHTPDLDGTMRGDMGIGYGTTGATPPADCQYPVNYTAHLKGFWGAASTYSWYSDLKSTSGAGPTFGNTYIGAATIPTNLGPPLIVPGETGKVDHIFLKVVDSNGGASATANYYMALHQPEEFLPSNQVTESIFKKKDEVETSAPGWATPGVGVNCTWNAPGAYWDYLSGGAAVMAEIPGADEALPWFGAFCAAAGVAVDHLKPLPCTGPVTFDPQNQGSDYPDETLHPFKTTDHRYFVMIPHFWDMYTRTHLLQDVWDKTGFVSETPINSDVFVRQAGSYGTYKYTTTLEAAVK